VTAAFRDDGWPYRGDALTDEQLLDAEEVEAAILAGPPTGLTDVERILEVLLLNEGERTDGLDRVALSNVRTFVRGLREQS